MIQRTTPVACLALLLLGACRSPSTEAVFHTLTPIAPEVAKPSPGKKLPALEVMPVRLPELLQRTQIVLAAERDGFRLSPVHRWGNSLEKDMQRVLIDNLGSLLEGADVLPYPLGEQTEAAFRLALDIQQCEGSPGRALRFRASWMVSRPGTNRMLIFRRVELTEPVAGNGIEDLVSAHSRIMAEVSRRIAGELINLPAVPPP